MSFNSIRLIQSNAFANLENLRQIHLDDNRIDKLEKQSFTNMESLQRLSLKGNKISNIAYEAFHNLPELEELDLSYNEIAKLEFQVFDQAGTLSMFRVNISYNKLHSLETSGDGNMSTKPGEYPTENLKQEYCKTVNRLRSLFSAFRESREHEGLGFVPQQYLLHQ